MYRNLQYGNRNRVPLARFQVRVLVKEPFCFNWQIALKYQRPALCLYEVVQKVKHQALIDKL